MIGTSLGPYRIEAELGSGGMGTVYRATDGARTVAVKVVHTHLTASEDFAQRFRREAELGMAVDHPNVVRTLGVGEQDGVRYLIMELVEGKTLAELTDELERLPEQLCVHVAREVCKALRAIHGVGAIHRDIKPANVLVTPDHVVKVMDLGVAKLVDASTRLSQTGGFVGSLNYAAPEQFRGGGKDLDHRVDLHALGLLLFEAATGGRAFDAEQVPALVRQVIEDVPPPVGRRNPQLSAFFEQVVTRLLEKDREKRFGGADALLLALEEGEGSAWWKAHARTLRVATRQPLRRVHIPRESALHGRDRDLARLQALYDEALRGHGQVLLLEGEAGVGKSRLVDEFVERLRRKGEDLSFLYGSYPPGGATAAASGFSAAYREQFGAAALSSVLETYLPETPLLVPAFAALLRGDAAADDAEPLTRESLQTVFVQASRALAAERPTIVLIDDLHFAPDDGRSLFTALSLALPGHRLLLVGTTRPGAVPGDWAAELLRPAHATHATLERLGAGDLRELLGETLRNTALAGELSDLIEHRSGGNPFFVFELLQGLRDGRFITQEADGTWVRSRTLEGIEVPSSVSDLVNARVAQLDREERELLDVASCCGFEFDPLLLGEAVRMEPIPLLRCLGRIERRHRLVRSVGRRCTFDHHQVQEALYTGLPVLLREAYHAVIAVALEERVRAAGGDPLATGGAQAFELCAHLFECRRVERAVLLVEPALAHLEASHLDAAAVALIDRALAGGDVLTAERRIDLLLRKATRLLHLGRTDERGAVLDAAEALGERGGEVALARGMHFTDIGLFEPALAEFDRAEASADDDRDPSVRAQAMNARGAALYRSGRTEEARTEFERAIEAFRGRGDARSAAGAIGNLGGLVLRQLGHLEEARECLVRRIEAAREHGDLRGEAVGTVNLGFLHRLLGQLPEARIHYERSIVIARRIGIRNVEAVGAGNLGVLLGDLGHLEEARGYVRRHLQIARETGNQALEATALVNLGNELSFVGQRQAAEEPLRSGAVLARGIGARRPLAGALELVAAHEVRGGQSTAARAAAEEGAGIARRIGDAEILAGCRLVLGTLAREDRDWPTAAVSLEQALETGIESRMPRIEVLARAQLAQLPGGDAAIAAASLAEHEVSIGVPAAMEVRFLLFQATGDPAHLAAAHEKLLFLRDHAGEEYRESILENVPLHRDIVAAWEARSDRA